MNQQQQSQSGGQTFASSTYAAPALSDRGRSFLSELAQRHDFGEAAVAAMLAALQRGGGNQAQFDHPEFGGMGQWSRGGMLMIGDMFNDALKAKVGALAQDAAAGLARGDLFDAPPPGSRSSDWPDGLGAPAATGSQNDMHYAFFPAQRRLVIKRGGVSEVYDTGEHQIMGFGQQQGGTTGLSFGSQTGPVSLEALRRIEQESETSAAPAQAVSPPASAPSPSDTAALQDLGTDRDGGSASIIAAIEGLAALHAKGILSSEEFAAKKAELLARI